MVQHISSKLKYKQKHGTTLTLMYSHLLLLQRKQETQILIWKSQTPTHNQFKNILYTIN